LTCRFGEQQVGVRADDPSVLTALRDALAAWVVDADVHATYSIHLGDTGTDAGRALAVLYRDGDLLLRSRSRGRALRALAAHLALYLPQPEGSVRLRALAAITDDGRAIVSPRPHHGSSTFDRHLAACRLHVVDGPVVLVDAAGIEVLVAQPFFDIDHPLAVVTSHGSEQPDPAPAAPGRYPIVAWCAPPLPSLAARVAYLASLAPDADERDLDRLGQLAANVAFVDDADDTGRERARRLAGLG
jgi:hypothetical protein